MIYKDIEWTDEKVKKFWDYESQFPEKYFTYTYGRTFLDEVESYITNAKSVLDYGTGIGILISQLLKYDFDISGTDFSHESIAIVNNKFKGNSNFKGAHYIDEIMNLNKKYDVIFCNEMIEHINDHYLDITFKNLKHLLSDDGIVIITTPNDEKLEDNMIFCANCDSTFHRWQHVKSWNTSSLKKVIIKYGFNTEKMYTTFFNPIVKEQKKSIPGLIASFIRKYILLRKGIKNTISTAKAPHLVAIIKK